MRRLLCTAALVVALAPGAVLAEESAPAGLRARVDPRVEAMSIVFRLAGNPEYTQGKIESYAKAVDARFGKLRDHAVVKRAAALRRARGVSFDAVMSLAVHLDADLRLAVPVEKAERLEKRWPREEVPAFVEELRDFAKQGDLAGFLREQKPLFDLAEKRLQALLDAKVRLGWFEEFFGARPAARFELATGPLLGGCNYGPSFRRPDGKEELWCILGAWQVDGEGNPVYTEEDVPTVVHEFCHSWANALVDAHMAALKGPGDRAWPAMREAMGAQAYADVTTTLYESLVRACVCRYMVSAGGEEAGRREEAEQVGRGFLWTREISAALAEYERSRKEHPTLDSFMPRVAKVLDAFVDRLAALEEKAPKVVSLVPAAGAKDVDPATTAIVVTFDRPMRDGAWAVVGGGPNFPKVTGKPSYDAARKVLTIPVELQPSWSYELWLNRGKFDSFQSAEGVKLRPVHVTFATRAK
jgi:hypothetical protein